MAIIENPAHAPSRRLPTVIEKLFPTAPRIVEAVMYTHFGEMITAIQPVLGGIEPIRWGG
jgi:hypothetical protein